MPLDPPRRAASSRGLRPQPLLSICMPPLPTFFYCFLPLCSVLQIGFAVTTLQEVHALETYWVWVEVLIAGIVGASIELFRKELEPMMRDIITFFTIIYNYSHSNSTLA